MFTYQVFSWYGATIEMDGTTETDYVADEVKQGSPCSYFEIVLLNNFKMVDIDVATFICRHQ